MKRKRNYFTSFLILLFFIGCSNNGCMIPSPSNRLGDVEFSAKRTPSEERKKVLLKYIAERTVRIIVQCQTIDKTTGKITQPYKPSGWGTGAVIKSTKNYSLIQTAAHVVSNTIKENSDLKKSCNKYSIEKRDLNNKVINTYDKVAIYKKNVKHDIAVLMIPYNLKVSSQFATSTYIGQRIHLLGYPKLRGVSGKHLSYAPGYIMTLNMGVQSTWKGTKDIARYSAVGYFGNSGGAVWDSNGKIVGVVTSMVGFRTLGGYVPQHGSLYGLDLKYIKKFYKDNQVDLN